MSTVLCVALSKTCSLIAPFALMEATNDLVNGHLHSATLAMLKFVLLRVASQTFKELQGIVYIKVKQQAAIQLQQTTFSHLHSLSLNWHLSKKTGSVVKSMDRGVEAANTLVTYLFLFLVPAMLEVRVVLCCLWSEVIVECCVEFEGRGRWTVASAVLSCFAYAYLCAFVHVSYATMLEVELCEVESFFFLSCCFCF